MKTVILLASTLMASTLFASSKNTGKWNIGAAAGWASTRTPVQVKSFIVTDPIDYYKTKVQGNGFVGGLNAEYVISTGKLLWGFGVAGYLDSYTARENSNKKNLTPIENFPELDMAAVKDSLKRNYTLEASMKVGHQIFSDINVYGKMGGLYSSFQYKYDRMTFEKVVSNSTKLNAWGGVIGMGIQKQYTPTLKIGLAYDFHQYESCKLLMKKNKSFTVGTATITNITHMRPQYHQVYFTLSKAL